MVFKSDKQRKGFFANQGNVKSNVTPELLKIRIKKVDKKLKITEKLLKEMKKTIKLQKEIKEIEKELKSRKRDSFNDPVFLSKLGPRTQFGDLMKARTKRRK